MVENRRPYLDIHVESHHVVPFLGSRVYVSTGDSDDMENGESVTYSVRPSRANVDPMINDVIFAKMANTDKTFLVNEDLKHFIFSTGFYDISSTSIYPQFLYYLIKSHQFDCYKNAYSEGTTQVSLSNDRFKRIKIPYETDIKKQKIIADKLDEMIKQTDYRINVLNQQINELQCLKLSFINEAIFGFQGPYVNVDKSWISTIPVNWEIKKFKLVFRICKGLGITKDNLIDGGNPVISYGQTHNESYKYEFNPTENALKGVDNSYLKERNAIMKKGDFIFVDTSEDIKGSTDFSMLNNDDFCFAGYHSLLAKPYVPIDNRFFMYLFSSPKWEDQIRSQVNGVKVYSITQSILSNVDVLVPPIEVQRTISKALDTKLSLLPKIIKIKNEQVIELQKLKTALIFEYVSGKKEI